MYKILYTRSKILQFRSL